MKKMIMGISFVVLCLILTIGSLAVSAASVTVLNDTGDGTGNWYLRDASSGYNDRLVQSTGADGTGKCLQFDVPSGKAMLCARNSAQITYKKGYTYTVAWKMKTYGNKKAYLMFFDGGGSAASPSITTSPQIPGHYNYGSFSGYDVTGSWNSFSCTFTVTGFKSGAESSNSIPIAFKLSSAGTLLIDDIVITETPCFTANVSVGENGSVKIDGADVTAGEFYVTEGKTITLDITPLSGYRAKVTVNEAEYVVRDNQVSVTVTEDTQINVSFDKETPVAPGFSAADSESWFKNVGGVPTIYTYHKLNNFNTGDEGLGYGVSLTCSEYPEAELVLPACEKNGDEVVANIAEPGIAFAIKMYGNAIVPEYTYTLRPYVGETYGDEFVPVFE